jgi:hypothetical protein
MTLNSNSATSTTLHYESASLSNIIGDITSHYSYEICDGYKETIQNMIKEEISKTPDVPVETKTKLVVKNGKIYVEFFEDGYFKSEKYIMPDIKDIKVSHDIVFVTFTDNTKTKAVLDVEDVFNIEQAVSICITKKLLGDSGDSIYNKLIRRAFKVKDQNEKKAKEAELKAAEEKRIKEVAISKYQKRKNKKREEAIEIQKEAYLRAMREFNGNN